MDAEVFVKVSKEIDKLLNSGDAGLVEVITFLEVTKHGLIMEALREVNTGLGDDCD